MTLDDYDEPPPLDLVQLRGQESPASMARRRRGTHALRQRASDSTARSAVTLPSSIALSPISSPIERSAERPVPDISSSASHEASRTLWPDSSAEQTIPAFLSSDRPSKPEVLTSRRLGSQASLRSTAAAGLFNLAQVSGVQESDTEHRLPSLGVTARTRPRLTLSPRSVMAAILILVCALAACLTLLFQQSANLSVADVQSSKGLAETVPKAGQQSTSDSTAGSSAATRQSGKSADGSGGSAAAAPGAAAATGAKGSSQAGTTPSSSTPSSPQGPSAQTPASPASPASGADSASTPAPSDSRVDINAATADQLETIKGIGPATAQKIIEYRTAHGSFSTVDDLLSVNGIGVKTVEKLRPYVAVR